MRQLLETLDWHTILDSLDTLQAWDLFVSHFELSLKECIPCKRPSGKKQNMFMTQQAIHLKNKKKETLAKIYFI